jgi:hypothetical protein
MGLMHPGPTITDYTLDVEAVMLAGTIINLGHIGNSQTYRGLPSGQAKAGQAVRSPAGSALCKMIMRAVGAVNVALDDNIPVPFKHWVAVQQEKWIRPLDAKGLAIRIAGTDFYF